MKKDGYERCEAINRHMTRMLKEMGSSGAVVLIADRVGDSLEFSNITSLGDDDITSDAMFKLRAIIEQFLREFSGEAAVGKAHEFITDKRAI